MLRAPQVKAANAAAASAGTKRSAPTDDHTSAPKRRRAPAKPKALNFDSLLNRVEKYMTKELPWSAGRSREISEAVRVACGIEKIMYQIAERCHADSPTLIKTRSMDTMINIWSIVVFTTGSYTHRGCMNDSSMWKKPSLQVWHSFNEAEKIAYACNGETVKELVEIAIEWKKYAVREKMFDTLLQDMKKAALVVSHMWDTVEEEEGSSDEMREYMSQAAGETLLQYYERWDKREEEFARQRELDRSRTFSSFAGMVRVLDANRAARANASTTNGSTTDGTTANGGPTNRGTTNASTTNAPRPVIAAVIDLTDPLD